MPASASLLIAAWLAVAPIESVAGFDAEGLDPVAVEAGLRVRLGDELDRWSIRVRYESPTRYRVELRLVGSAAVQADQRVVILEGPSDVDRSRELASTLALIIEEADGELGGLEAEPETIPKTDPDTDLNPAADLELPVGFVVVEAHVGLGPPRKLDPDFGLGLGAGAWLLGDHLQPRVRVGWSHSWAGALEVHQVNAGLGLAGGTALGRFWVGALVMPAIKWTYARQISSSSGWFGGGEASLIVQYRRPHVVLGLRTGVDTTFPAPRVPGTQDVIRWGHLRWLCVFEVGIGV